MEEKRRSKGNREKKKGGRQKEGRRNEYDERINGKEEVWKSKWKGRSVEE